MMPKIFAQFNVHRFARFFFSDSFPHTCSLLSILPFFPFGMIFIGCELCSSCVYSCFYLCLRMRMNVWVYPIFLFFVAALFLPFSFPATHHTGCNDNLFLSFFFSFIFIFAIFWWIFYFYTLCQMLTFEAVTFMLISNDWIPYAFYQKQPPFFF